MQNINQIKYLGLSYFLSGRPPKPIIWIVLPTVFAGAVMGILGLGFASHGGCSGIGGFGADPGTIPRSTSNLTVFAAAPVSSKCSGPEILALGRLYAPPPYVRMVSLNEQSVQLNPSSCCAPPVTEVPKNWGPRPGMVGVRFEIAMDDWSGVPGGTGGDGPSANAEEDCTTVEVWMPDETTSAQQAPAMNDPNATIILDITPPQKKTKSDCTVWHHHKEAPPPMREKHRGAAPEHTESF